MSVCRNIAIRVITPDHKLDLENARQRRIKMNKLTVAATLLLLAGCGGQATSYSGNATGGDGVRGNIDPTVTLSIPCRASASSVSGSSASGC
jgi:uncharacterized lipoprotein YajG